MSNLALVIKTAWGSLLMGVVVVLQQALANGIPFWQALAFGIFLVVIVFLGQQAQSRLIDDYRLDKRTAREDLHQVKQELAASQGKNLQHQQAILRLEEANNKHELDLKTALAYMAELETQLTRCQDEHPGADRGGS